MANFTTLTGGGNAGQFAVTSVWEKNAEICASLMAQAAENDVSLFVLPEALLARDDHDADLSVKSAQLLEGEFLGLYGEKVNVT